MNYEDRVLAPKELSVLTVRISDASSNAEIIPTPGAGKRLRLYGASISQMGTGNASVALRWLTGGTDFFKKQIPNSGIEATVPGLNGRNYIQSDDDQGLFLVATDQATDLIDVNVAYTIEEN